MKDLWTDWTVAHHSPVFRDMLAIPSNGVGCATLELSDPIENGTSVKDFLDLLYGQPVPRPKTGSTSLNSIGALKMIQMYDCAGARRLVLYAYGSMLLTHRVMAIYIFRAASVLDSIQTCQLAIRNDNGAFWPEPKEITSGPREHRLPKRSGFDPRAIPFEMMETIPTKFSAALQKAHLKVDLESTEKLAGRKMTKAERDKYADEFLRLMEAKRK
jgi:hypothetical protein